MSLLKIAGDLAVEQFIMQITCASKSQYLTCEVLTFTGTSESIYVRYVEIWLSPWICKIVISIGQKNSKNKEK